MESGSVMCGGVSRRHWLQAGLGGAIGLSLPEILRKRAMGAQSTDLPERRETSVIFVELAGGPTQHETYDPKADAPLEYRGPLSAISTALPGVSFSELMVHQAAVADRLAVVRSIHHTSGSHGTSSHLTQTGYYLRDNQNRDNEMPCVGSYAAKMRGANADGVPAFVSIPRSMRFGRSAWLGKGYNPFETVLEANDKNFQVPNLTLLDGITSERLNDRRSLLAGFDAARRTIDNAGVAGAIDDFTAKAFEMVTGDAARTAFDLSRETDENRNRYGATVAGTNMLLARRLVEHGVTFVTVRVAGWDDHVDVEGAMKKKGPAFDQGLAALIHDIYERGLDEKVLVVVMGEFGRTPRVNKSAGRDHWGQVMSVLLSGGGLNVGQVIGASDSKGAVPVDRPYRPEHVLSMVYRHLGIDPAHHFTDNSGRPRALLELRGMIRELG